MKSESSAKIIKQASSANRLQTTNTMKNSLIQDEANLPGDLYNELSDRQKRKSIHYNSVGRQANVSGPKKPLGRQTSFVTLGNQV